MKKIKAHVLCGKIIETGAHDGLLNALNMLNFAYNIVIQQSILSPLKNFTSLLPRFAVTNYSLWYVRRFSNSAAVDR